uniref:Uncharacterized protein n=1 Tax=Toxoplasma gondii COUG TaxID=1074873 RepID=A0A2G8Y3T0_TOXGO|nr:hypothetical protein TGCOUG_392800 [Toxoplasma gondii COUG]
MPRSNSGGSTSALDMGSKDGESRSSLSSAHLWTRTVEVVVSPDFSSFLPAEAGDALPSPVSSSWLLPGPGVASGCARAAPSSCFAQRVDVRASCFSEGACLSGVSEGGAAAPGGTTEQEGESDGVDFGAASAGELRTVSSHLPPSATGSAGSVEPCVMAPE